MLALVDYTGLSAAEVARRAGLAATTIQRPIKGTADTRISQRTIEKLHEAFPKFPGWTRAGAAALASFDKPETQMVEIASIDLNFGLGAAFMDSEIVEHAADTMLFPRDWLRSITRSPPERLYWAKGLGNSMEPTIGDGDVILIDRSAAGSSFGDLYWAIAYGQTGMIKRLRPMPDGSVKILSDNPNVPPEIAHDGELHVFGRVIAVVRRI
ncbi:helix-turn-helix transcriptional regulator [Erythrobacter sp. NE805]|uniref:LexA family transcriptional regulator n=1 Tax=Erythrobacter sp. NE805 TaxID=3389875 RepID=UPI00396B25A1